MILPIPQELIAECFRWREWFFQLRVLVNSLDSRVSILEGTSTASGVEDDNAYYKQQTFGGF